MSVSLLFQPLDATSMLREGPCGFVPPMAAWNDAHEVDGGQRWMPMPTRSPARNTRQVGAAMSEGTHHCGDISAGCGWYTAENIGVEGGDCCGCFCFGCVADVAAEHAKLLADAPKRRGISAKLKARLRRDRTMVALTVRMPKGVVDDLAARATKGKFSTPQALVRSYVGRALRVEASRERAEASGFAFGAMMITVALAKDTLALAAHGGCGGRRLCGPGHALVQLHDNVRAQMLGLNFN